MHLNLVFPPLILFNIYLQNSIYYTYLLLIFPHNSKLQLYFFLPIFKATTSNQVCSMADNKEWGIVKTGHDEGMKMSISLLQEFELSEGLLPLANVVEVGYVKNTGYMWIMKQKKMEHEFKMISKLVSYDTEINGFVEKKKIKKLKGVKAKELMLWPSVSEITIDDKQRGKIHFKSLAGITKTFPLEVFVPSQWWIDWNIYLHAFFHFISINRTWDWGE